MFLFRGARHGGVLRGLIGAVLLPSACGALLLTACGGAASDEKALVGVTVIDGLGNQPKTNQAVVLRGDRIAEIMPAASYEAPRGALVIELPGRYVIPGLIDTHAHFSVHARKADGTMEAAPDTSASEQSLRTLLAFGITTVRNPAAVAADAVALRQRVASGELVGPRILTSGEALNRTALPFGPFVATPDEASVRQEVQRQADLGVDYIKVYSALPPELVEAAIDEAHQHGLKVVGHVQRTTWTEAAELGIDAITHAAPWSPAYLPEAEREGYRGTMRGRLDWLEKVDFEGEAITEMIAALAERQIPVDPTLIVFHTKHFDDSPQHRENPELQITPEIVLAGWQQGSFVADWTPEDFERAHQLWPRVLELTRKMHEGGVLLTAGSDYPNPWVIPGVGLHHELRLLHDAGIEPLEVLKIATYNAAVSLGLSDEIGSIEPGKRADLLVLASDPSASLHSTRAISHIFQGGRFLDPSALLASDAS